MENLTALCMKAEPYASYKCC